MSRIPSKRGVCAPECSGNRAGTSQSRLQQPSASGSRLQQPGAFASRLQQPGGIYGRPQQLAPSTSRLQRPAAVCGRPQQPVPVASQLQRPGAVYGRPQQPALAASQLQRPGAFYGRPQQPGAATSRLQQPGVAPCRLPPARGRVADPRRLQQPVCPGRKTPTSGLRPPLPGANRLPCPGAAKKQIPPSNLPPRPTAPCPGKRLAQPGRLAPSGSSSTGRIPSGRVTGSSSKGRVCPGPRPSSGPQAHSTLIEKPTPSTSKGKLKPPPPKKRPSKLQKFDKAATAELSRKKDTSNVLVERTTSDAALIEAVDRLAKAEAAHSFRGAVKAAEEAAQAAAEAAPPGADTEKLEEAATAAVKSFQTELVHVVNEQVPGLKPVQLLGYVGITRPTRPTRAAR